MFRGKISISIFLLSAVFFYESRYVASNSLYARGVSSGSEGDTVTWSFGLNGAQGSIEYDMAVLFQNLVEERSKGMMKVKLFGGGQLGDDTS